MRWIFLLGNTYNKTVTWYNVSNDFHIYKSYKYGLSSLFFIVALEFEERWKNFKTFVEIIIQVERCQNERK